jgi:hypothetical protein
MTPGQTNLRGDRDEQARPREQRSTGPRTEARPDQAETDGKKNRN